MARYSHYRVPEAASWDGGMSCRAVTGVTRTVLRRNVTPDVTHSALRYARNLAYAGIGRLARY